MPKGDYDNVIDTDGLQTLVKTMAESPRIDSVEIFPRGIVNPEVFSARIGPR